MIRPEVWAALVRWREAVVGLAFLALGGYWFFAGRGLILPIGAIVGLFGILLLLAGIERGRFRRGSGGHGVVQLDEGEVTYFGPLSGGSVSVKELKSVELEALSKKVRHWILTDKFGTTLNIPVDAEGVEALFDVFTSLVGINTTQMLADLNSDGLGRVSVWQSNVTSLH